MKKRILITGVNGFIGSSLWRFINKNGFKVDVYGVARKSARKHKNIFICSLTDRKKVYKILSKIKPNYIFHFAGGRIKDRVKLYENNFLTTQILFESINKISGYRPRVIIPGTAAEYGEVDIKIKLIKESVVPNPVSWYGFVKYMQTSLGLMYAQNGFDVVIARMFNISGYGTPSTLAIGKFSEEISLIERRVKSAVVCSGNLDGKRDFLDIDDVCSALWALAKYGKSGEIYNICSGKSYTIGDLLQKLILKSKVKNIVSKKNRNNLYKSFDVIGSNSRIKRATDWKPRISIKKSLENTLSYYRKGDH